MLTVLLHMEAYSKQKVLGNASLLPLSILQSLSWKQQEKVVRGELLFSRVISSTKP